MEGLVELVSACRAADTDKVTERKVKLRILIEQN